MVIAEAVIKYLFGHEALRSQRRPSHVTVMKIIFLMGHSKRLLERLR